MHRKPSHKFLGSQVMPNSKHWKPFGCTMYILAQPYKQEVIYPISVSKGLKWEYNLGYHHCMKNVSLVLKQVKGHVIPQFYIYLDPVFHKVKQDGFDLWRDV